MSSVYDEDHVKKIILRQFPDYKIYQITMVGAGNDCDAYLVNGEYVFKFPKHQRASDNLLKEISVLVEIQDKLPIPIPKVVFKGYPSECFGMYFAGYNKIDGEVLTPDLLKTLPPEHQDQVAVDLAHFLRVLHNTEINNLKNDLIIDMREKYMEEYREIKKIIVNALTANQQQVIDNFYRDLLSNEDYFRHESHLIHNDFSSDHILYDIRKNRICGIIDFGDVAISDPDNDFMNLFEEDEEYGAEFSLKVLKYYRHKDMDLVLKKFHFKEKYWSFEKILYGREYGYGDWYEEGINEIKELKGW